MDAWENLIDGSMITEGDAWEHLVAQGGGGIVGEVVILADGIGIHVDNSEVNVMTMTDDISVVVEDIQIAVKVAENSVVNVAVKDDDIKVEIDNGN